MKNDLFYMALSVLSLWKQDNPSLYFCCVLANEDEDDYETIIVDKKTDRYSNIFDLFSESMDTENSILYITMTPSDAIIEQAIFKNLQKIIYLPTKTENSFKNFECINIMPFNHTFGRIIDILSQYKPRVSNINMS